MTMGYLRTALCFSIFVSGTCFSQEASRRDTGQDQKALLLQLTHDVLDAELRSDHATMERLFTENYTHTHQSGAFQNKAEFMVEFVPGKQKYRIAEISEVQVRNFGTSAIVNGHENIND